MQKNHEDTSWETYLVGRDFRGKSSNVGHFDLRVDNNLEFFGLKGANEFVIELLSTIQE